MEGSELQAKRTSYVKTQSSMFKELRALHPGCSRDVGRVRDQAGKVSWNQIMQDPYLVLKVMRGH